jgi:putative peptidoglycan lipid II flippase
LASLDYAEMGRCVLAAIGSGAAVWMVFTWLGSLMVHSLSAHLPAQSRWTDFAVLMGGMTLWLAVTAWILEKAGSALPTVAKRRLGLE